MEKSMRPPYKVEIPPDRKEIEALIEKQVGPLKATILCLLTYLNIKDPEFCNAGLEILDKMEKTDG